MRNGTKIIRHYEGRRPAKTWARARAPHTSGEDARMGGKREPRLPARARCWHSGNFFFSRPLVISHAYAAGTAGPRMAIRRACESETDPIPNGFLTHKETIKQKRNHPVTLRIVSSRFVPSRSFRIVSFRSVSFRSVSFRSVPLPAGGVGLVDNVAIVTFKPGTTLRRGRSQCYALLPRASPCGVRTWGRL